MMVDIAAMIAAILALQVIARQAIAHLVAMIHLRIFRHVK